MSEEAANCQACGALDAFRASPVNTADATAEFLGVNRKTVYAGVADGTIPALRLGKKVLIKTQALLDLIGA